LVLPGVVLAAALVCVAQDSGTAPVPAPHSAVQATDGKSKPTKSDGQRKVSSADTAKQKLIADESAQLLTMALALKAEVDKTTKDTLSLNVIKKADEIEKLAKSVKEKMKQGSGS
jgi:hypothetical protein